LYFGNKTEIPFISGNVIIRYNPYIPAITGIEAGLKVANQETKTQ